jgi:hypothetical protein
MNIRWEGNYIRDEKGVNLLARFDRWSADGPTSGCGHAACIRQCGNPLAYRPGCGWLLPVVLCCFPGSCLREAGHASACNKSSRNEHIEGDKNLYANQVGPYPTPHTPARVD